MGAPPPNLANQKHDWEPKCDPIGLPNRLCHNYLWCLQATKVRPTKGVGLGLCAAVPEYCNHHALQ